MNIQYENVNTQCRNALLLMVVILSYGFNAQAKGRKAKKTGPLYAVETLTITTEIKDLQKMVDAAIAAAEQKDYDAALKKLKHIDKIKTDSMATNKQFEAIADTIEQLLKDEAWKTNKKEIIAKYFGLLKQQFMAANKLLWLKTKNKTEINPLIMQLKKKVLVQWFIDNNIQRPFKARLGKIHDGKLQRRGPRATRGKFEQKETTTVPCPLIAPCPK